MGRIVSLLPPCVAEILTCSFDLDSFLRHIARIAGPDYIPSIGIWNLFTNVSYHSDTRISDDILHARVQTMGVAEHIFDVNIHGKTVAWHLYDVGGARPQRHAWAPYFDDGELSHLTPYSCPRPTTRPNPPFSWFYDPSSSQLITPPTSQSTQSSS